MRSKYWRLAAATAALLAVIMGAGTDGKEETQLVQRLHPQTAGEAQEGRKAGLLWTKGGKEANGSKDFFTFTQGNSLRAGNGQLSAQPCPMPRSLGSGKEASEPVLREMAGSESKVLPRRGGSWGNPSSLGRALNNLVDLKVRTYTALLSWANGGKEAYGKAENIQPSRSESIFARFYGVAEASPSAFGGIGAYQEWYGNDERAASQVDRYGSTTGKNYSPATVSVSVASSSKGFTTDGLHSAGVFKVTAYTAGPESTGKKPGDEGYGEPWISGSKYADFQPVLVEEGRTIAADFTVLPPLTRVYIEGVGERVVEDKGGAIKGKKLDLYIADLDEALEWGVQERQVWVIEWGGKKHD